MSLYLNLYHEVQNKKLKRQRDPLKIGIMALAVVAMGFVLYYIWRFEAVRSIRFQAAGVQSDWIKLSPKQKTAQARRDELDQNRKIAEGIVHHVENRFYWGPLLDQFIQVIPPSIQITVLDGELALDGSKKVTLTVSGISTGDQPRAVAEELRIALQNKLALQYQQVTSVFGSLDEGIPIQYQGRSSPSATFVINISFICPDVDATKTDAKPQPAAPSKS
jgi:Tfp pilus assembly protein PilN